MELERKKARARSLAWRGLKRERIAELLHVSGATLAKWLGPVERVGDDTPLRFEIVG